MSAGKKLRKRNIMNIYMSESESGDENTTPFDTDEEDNDKMEDGEMNESNEMNENNEMDEINKNNEMDEINKKIKNHVDKILDKLKRESDKMKDDGKMGDEKDQGGKNRDENGQRDSRDEKGQGESRDEKGQRESRDDRGKGGRDRDRNRDERDDRADRRGDRGRKRSRLYNRRRLTRRNTRRRYGNNYDRNMYSHYNRDDEEEEEEDVFDNLIIRIPSIYNFDSDKCDERITREINSVDDLIELGNMFDPFSSGKYNIDLRTLNKLVEPLEELKKMVGMKSIKDNIVNLIVYYMQGFERENQHMLHTVIEGPPGSGKTTVARIVAQIYLKLGIIKKDLFKIVRRSDLIGKYLGHTAIKTQEVIDSVMGGVLFIDEAYSLGNPEGRDSFSKECIDTLNQNLSDEKCNFICIIAGYKDKLKDSFFAYNDGLERRFPFRYTIDDYTAVDLHAIFLKTVTEYGWTVKEDIPLAFFENNRVYFKYNGGDMETLFQMTKIGHARRVFCLSSADKKGITMEDIKYGMKLFMNNDEVQKRDNDMASDIHASMYM